MKLYLRISLFDLKSIIIAWFNRMFIIYVVNDVIWKSKIKLEWTIMQISLNFYKKFWELSWKSFIIALYYCIYYWYIV